MKLLDGIIVFAMAFALTSIAFGDDPFKVVKQDPFKVKVDPFAPQPRDIVVKKAACPCGCGCVDCDPSRPCGCGCPCGLIYWRDPDTGWISEFKGDEWTGRDIDPQGRWYLRGVPIKARQQDVQPQTSGVCRS